MQVVSDWLHPHDCFLCYNLTAGVALVGGPVGCMGGMDLLPDSCANPGPGQVSLYQDANYQGSCSIRGIGQYSNSSNLGVPNDSVSSIRLGPGVAALLCQDANFSGSCKWLASPTFGSDRRSTAVNIPHLSSHWRNDSLSSLKVEWLLWQLGPTKKCRVPQYGEVSIYQDVNFLGNCSTLPAGGYTNSSFLGIPNDSASSAILGPGTAASLCQNANYGGACDFFVQPEWHLAANTRLRQVVEK